jgi:two-component sensor histidine kinase
MRIPAAAAVAAVDVDITAELSRRAPIAPDYLSEKLALQDLAFQMAEHPEQVLPHLVQLAMKTCEAAAAGISLYEADGEVFRWHHLSGKLSKFNGATTPRHFSPCGVCLDRQSPVLMKNPERVYGWIADAGIAVPEVLLVPLFVGPSEPLGTLWIVAREGEQFHSDHARAMSELASFAGIALRMIRTEEKLKQALETQETLTKEMSHRVKNVFAIADGMIRISARTAATPAELAQSISARLHALARAHGLVRRTLSDSAYPQRIHLDALLQTILQPHGSTNFKFGGPEIALGERAISGLALVFHELATNAAKYGALREDGFVDVSWRTQGDDVVVNWCETGGPEIAAPPTRTGFGTVLSQRTVKAQFRGRIDYDWKREGVAVTMTVPASGLEQ